MAKAKLPRPLEKHIQRQILDYLKLKGVFAWPNKTIGVFDASRGCYRRPVDPHWLNGVPDILALTKCGTFIAIEVKRPGAKPTPEQLRFIDNVLQRKNIAFVAYSLKDVQDKLIAFLNT